jgi:Fibronectin type III domain
MPTISQLPSASLVSAADEVPISQGGAARAISVGALLASTQSVILVGSPSLLGRTSLGPGGPEQVEVGLGMSISNGSLVANGLDHADFPATPSLSTESDLVVSNHGSPMLMQASLLRGLFSAGQNVAIDSNGVISTSVIATASGGVGFGSSIGHLQMVSALASQDLVAVSHAGSDCAIPYSNFIGGVTIDQAQTAGPAGDADAIWAAQGSNVMASQSFGAIWVWIASKLGTYKPQVVEITVNTNLDATVHNNRILVCSQPVTLIPLTSNMGSGFQCTVINASAGNITLGSAFISSSGSLVIKPWQSATLSCAEYSAGLIAFAAMPASTSVIAIPGQVGSLSCSSVFSTTITVSWQAPPSGGGVASYIVQFRPTGTTPWGSSSPIASATTYQLTALQPATSYDILVIAQNAAGAGLASTVFTVVTSTASQLTAPPQVSGLTASPTSSSAVQLTWSAQTGVAAAASFTVQYRVTGASGWTFSVAGLTGTGTAISSLQASTSYDFSVVSSNSAGAGPVSSSVTVTTLPNSQSVGSITWNLTPSGTIGTGSGAIGVNAHVSPAESPIQFGFSSSTTAPPSNWTAAVLVNTNLWGAYVTAPATAGNWYAWAEGLDGSGQTVSPSPFLVQ